jgi:viroplasmin and RNaseH domain-containing protein
MAFKCYAVAKGRKPGIYDRWYGIDQAFEQIDGYPKPRFKGFNSRPMAEEWLKFNMGMSQQEYDRLVDKYIAGDRTVLSKLVPEAERSLSSKLPWE